MRRINLLKQSERGALPVGGSFLALVAMSLSGCAALPSAGPSTSSVKASKTDSVMEAPIHVVDLTDTMPPQLVRNLHAQTFANELGDGITPGLLVQSGDVLDISIWEAPPAALFGMASSALGVFETPSVSRQTPLPEQMVDSDGTIRVPFAGTIAAAGYTTAQIATAIRARLLGKAHDPQVIVRITRNAASNVTIVGEVANSTRMPLTAKGERLLDALASAGGVRQPVGKMTIQITRGEKVEAMPLAEVIKDPRQNIRLQADDVVTLLFQPYSFTVLGAARSNQEIPFEGTGLTLSQALGRMGGLDDQRANPRGVFIFRFEDPKFLYSQSSVVIGDGKVPVIYRVNMGDPKTLFVAQSFLIRDKDLIYISNSPLADFSKFLQAVSQIVYPIATIQNTTLLK